MRLSCSSSPRSCREAEVFSATIACNKHRCHRRSAVSSRGQCCTVTWTPLVWFSSAANRRYEATTKLLTLTAVRWLSKSSRSLSITPVQLSSHAEGKCTDMMIWSHLLWFVAHTHTYTHTLLPAGCVCPRTGHMIDL